MEIQKQINFLLKKRDGYIQKRNKSWDKKKREYGIEPKEIDELAKEILKYLKEGKSILPIDYILETTTELGWAPDLIYDDNGHFAVSTSGFIPVTKTPESGTFTVWIEKKQWKSTIRKAVEYWISK